MNDYQFKVAKIKGEFIWHNHKNTDEAFIIIEGSMKIALNDRIINLSEGDLYIVPKGVEHRPRTNGEIVYNLLFEPKSTAHTGDTKSELTVNKQNWI